MLKHLHRELSTGEPGGAAAREALVEWPELTRPQPLWLIECGNFAAPQAYYPVPRTRTHLRALASLAAAGFAAAVPGGMELQLDAEAARELFAGSPVVLTSCNLESRLPEVKIAPGVELAPGWRLLGVSSWQPAVGEPPADRWWELGDPVAAVEAALAELPAATRVIVVAQYQPAAVARRLAALPVTLLVGFRSESDPQWPAGLAPALAAPPDRGKQLALVSLNGAVAGQRPDIEPWEVELDEAWPDDEEIVALLAEEKEDIKRQLHAQLAAGGEEGWRGVDWSSAERYLPPTPEQQARDYLASPARYLGDRECLECHGAAHQVWKASRHAQAFVELMSLGEHETLDCLGCHVTGLLQPGGFNPYDRQEGVSSVSCEACHGPGSLHVGRMVLGGAQTDLGIRRGSLTGCADCHDSYNSPLFESEQYWAKIAH